MSTSRGPSASVPPPPGERRRARERALGLLYEQEMKHAPLSELLAELPVAPEPYASALALGVEANRARIDALIGAHASAWALSRMPAVDRQLLRLATYELLFEDVPGPVVLDEAVELAKQYSTEGSGRYVNGVLAAVAAEARPGELARR